MEIRPLSLADLPDAVVINNANLPALTAADETEMGDLFTEAAYSLGAFVDDVLAGFSITFLPGADYDSVNYRWFAGRYDRFAYLDRIALADEFQGRGIGAALYSDLETRLRAEHPACGWLTCEVNLRPLNEGSLRFHHRIGFAEVGQQETDYGKLVSMLAKAL